MMDRLASLGAGLTPAQRNDWSWFKTAWDEMMCEEHDGTWGSVFAGCMQKVMNDLQEPELSNVWSTFVNNEIHRCFSNVPALCV